MIGTEVAHYQITELIGEGGMGKVYRAIDAKLGRDVALKVLPEAFTGDPQRVLVLELIEGETLEERIRRGPVPLEESLRISGQLAAGNSGAPMEPGRRSLGLVLGREIPSSQLR